MTVGITVLKKKRKKNRSFALGVSRKKNTLLFYENYA